MPVKRFGGKRKATNAATEDFIGTVLSKNDIVVDAIVVRDNTVFSDLAYVENDAWRGWGVRARRVRARTFDFVRWKTARFEEDAWSLSR